MTTYDYDTYGNVINEYDPNGNPPTHVDYETQTYTYPEYIYNPLGHTIKYVVDYRYGYATQKIDENNNAFNYFYDPFGRLTLTQNPDGGSTEIFYSDVSDVNAFPRYIFTQVKETATSYIPAYAFFDGFDRSIQTVALGEKNDDNTDKYIISKTYYDEMGRTVLTEGPFFANGLAYPQVHPAKYPYALTQYDYRGRPVTIKSPHGDYEGELITTSYAYQGFRTTVTDPDGSVKREVKDHLGRIIRVREWLMENGAMNITITNYNYNAAGDLLKVTDTKGNITTLAYDTQGHKRDMVDPDMGHWTYNYDKNGNLTNQFDAKGQEIRFTYDSLNRVLSKNYYINGQLSTVDSPVVNTYDNTTADANGIGRPYTSTKGNIVIINNKYDSMGRNLVVIKKIDGVSYKTLTQYDLSGKVTQLTYPNNTDTTLVTNEYYPGTNLLKQVVTNGAITALYTDYAPTGKIGQITYPNGIYTFYNYDAWSTKLFGIVTTNNPSNTDPTKDLQNREYTYSRAGDILQIQDNAKGIIYDYTYDTLHRLIGEELSGPNAPQATRVEIITLDYTGTGPVHGVKTIDLNGVSRTCAYDLNGNMVTSPDFTNATNPLNRTITYDMDNMPTRIVHANGTTVDFTYGGIGKRTKKLVASGKTVLYLGDHFEVENGTTIKYIFGGNLRLAQIKGSLTNYFHKDHLGSTAAVTDETGQTKEGTTYEPFGSTRAHEGTDVSAYKFTDQELDNETNLYNYDARLYDPVLGMFVTPDSIVPNMSDPQSLNRYAYCRNNPLIYIDPSGHEHLEKGSFSDDDMGKIPGSPDGKSGGTAKGSATSKDDDKKIQDIKNKLKSLDYIIKEKNKKNVNDIISKIADLVKENKPINVSDLLGMFGLDQEAVDMLNSRGKINVTSNPDGSFHLSNSGEEVSVKAGSISVLGIEVDIKTQLDKKISADLVVAPGALSIDNIQGISSKVGIMGGKMGTICVDSTGKVANIGIGFSGKNKNPDNK